MKYLVRIFDLYGITSEYFIGMTDECSLRSEAEVNADLADARQQYREYLDKKNAYRARKKALQQENADEISNIIKD